MKFLMKNRLIINGKDVNELIVGCDREGNEDIIDITVVSESNGKMD